MIMPRHLLSSLSNLEELYIPRGFSPRDGPQEEEEEDPNPIHHELSKLTNLTTLHIFLPDVMFLPNEKICKKLLRYVIDITPPDDELFGRLQSRDAKRVLRLAEVSMQGDRSSSLEMLLESVEYMVMEGVNGFQTYFNHGVGEGKAFANLAKLSISECDDLEHLGISRLQQNYQQHQPMRSFSKLTKLRIHKSGFKYLFCPSSARLLVQLRKLSIRNCRMMKAIIRPREQEEEEIIEFPNLKDMHLVDLPSLKSFFYCKKIIYMWSDQNTSAFPIHSLFNAMVSFPVLKGLTMYGVKNVIEIWEPQCHTENSFSQLKILDVSLCDKLENVIPFAMLRRLQNMETLNVEYCSSLKCIVNGAKTTTAEDQEGSGSEIVFPVLKTLSLAYIDNLWCSRSMGSNTDQHQPSILQKVSFPRLEVLWVRGISSEASNLVELMGVNANLPRDHGIHHLLCFRGLKMLTVEDCKLSTLFTCYLAKTNLLQQLEELIVGSCEKMEEIVRDENEGNMNLMADAADEILSCEFPRLKRIKMGDLPVLKSFCGSERYTFNMPSLERVLLRNCPLLRNFTCRQLTTPPKFTISDDDWSWKECTDLDKYLQTLLVDRPEGGDM